MVNLKLKMKKFLLNFRIIHYIYEIKCTKGYEKTEQKRVKAVKKHGKDVLQKVSNIFIKENIKCFAFCGTLLGLVRDNELIPYDNDIDFAFIPDEKTDFNTVKILLEKNNFSLVHWFIRNGSVTEITFEYKKVKNLFVDIFLIEKSNNNFSFYNYSKESPASDQWYTIQYTIPKIETVEIRKFNNYNILVPKNAEEFLESHYGKTWKTPIKNWDAYTDYSVFKNDTIIMYTSKKGDSWT